MLLKTTELVAGKAAGGPNKTVYLPLVKLSFGGT